MAVKNKENTVKFGLLVIEILEERIEFQSKNIAGLKKFNFTVNIERKIDHEKKYAIVTIEILIASDEVQEKLGSLKLSFVYEILNFELFFDSKSKLVKFPPDFDSRLNSISISTARGVMFSQFKGTFLHRAILPIIDPNSLVLNDKLV